MLLFQQNLNVGGGGGGGPGTGYAPGDCWAAGTWFVGTWAAHTWAASFIVGDPSTRRARFFRYFFGAF